MTQKRFAVPVHTLFVVPVIAKDAAEAAEMGRAGVRRMLARSQVVAAAGDSFHIDAASVLTSPQDVTELPPPA